MATWTAPYFGVQHLESQSKRYRATVSDHGTFAELARWVPGCGFNPATSKHASADEARTAGAAWLAEAA